jgi:hypothetical protein
MRYFQFMKMLLPLTNLIAEILTTADSHHEKRMIVKQIVTSAADIIPIIAPLNCDR